MSELSQLTLQEQERFNVINQLLQKKLTNGQAATMLKISLRQIKRLKKKVREQGGRAVVHRLKGQGGNHHKDPSVKVKALGLIKTKYSDFKPTFASEKLTEDQGLAVNSQTLRKWMIEEGLWMVKKQRKKEYRAFRERLAYFGELEQFDGSYHYWFERRLLDKDGDPQEVCLLAAIDDATGKITKAKFALNEGVVAVFTFWKEYVTLVGKPLKIYLDKFSTYKVNHKAAVDNSELLTQFQQAMKLLNIELIPANSPEAKGRIERLFGTLQDRLVKELRLAQISTLTEGNKFIEEIFIPKFNAQFAVIPAKEGDVHRRLTNQEIQSLPSTFSLKSVRRINNDYTVQFKNHFYQLEEIQPVTIRPKDNIIIEKHLDGSIHLVTKSKQLNFFVLSARPKKLLKQPAILTNHPLNFKPSANHPWRQYKQKLPPAGGDISN